MLDQRLQNRVSLTSQRTAIDHPPAAAQGTLGNEDAKALFRKWIEHPCRPDGNFIIVDSTRNPEMLRDEILERIVG